MNHALLPRVSTAQLPATYEAAKIAISECSRIDECKDWSDKALALASYAKQADDKEMEKHAMRIRARAIRRCGELLKEVEKAQGKNHGQKGTLPPFSNSRKTVATHAGMSERQAKTAIRVANVPQETFLDQVDSEEPPTVTKLASQGKQTRPTPSIFEQQGMTKQAFQAGMYLAGSMQTYLKETLKFDPQTVVDGRTSAERKKLRDMIAQIDSYHDQLIAKL